MTTSTAVLAEAFAAVLGVLAVWALAGLAIAAVIRYHGTPVELRGDWWTPFEREFRAYAKAVSSAADDRGADALAVIRRRPRPRHRH